ncbi:MAG: hypothetical protein ISR65_02910 [Bacteriovoracaceae bacterium]|nr:hypothetical protein [Bacteriovoracaceae bacterium]
MRKKNMVFGCLLILFSGCSTFKKIDEANSINKEEERARSHRRHFREYPYSPLMRLE